jgi:hypothetical protein
MTKKDIVKAILDTAGLKGTARQQYRAKLTPFKKAELQGILANAVAQAQAQGKKQQKPRRQSTASSGGTRKSRKLPKSLKARAGKISRAIAAGKIVAKQQKRKPSDYASGTSREKYEKFVALYAGVRVPKKGAQTKGPSIKQVYQQVKTSGRRKKYPYYLSRGYHVKAFNVGGGKKGAGIVRRIPGYQSKPFSQLSATEKKRVVSFLNGPGAGLRSKGAPKQVNLQAALQQGKKAS